MGQKTNPNSFNSLKKYPKSWGACKPSEYSSLIRKNLLLTNIIRNYFEKKKIIIKTCVLIWHKEEFSITLFLSFILLKRKKRRRRRRKKRRKNLSYKNKRRKWKRKKILKRGSLRLIDCSTPFSLVNHYTSSRLFRKLTRIPIPILQYAEVSFFYLLLKKFGFFSFKRIIFRNLKDKTIVKSFKSRLLKKYKRESFYKQGILLYSLFLKKQISGMSYLFSNFISQFLKKLHRTSKSNRFLFFIKDILKLLKENAVSKKTLKGIKVQIKGRFRGISRTKKILYKEGQMPLQTIDSLISYSVQHVNTTYGVFSVKVWVCEVYHH